MKTYIAESCILLGICIFFFPQQASALTVSPALQKLYVKPGDQIIETVTLFNERAERITVYPSAENFKPKDAYGTPEFLGDADLEGAARWIEIPFKSITLKPYSKQEALFKIHIPLWTRPGGHYAALFWSDAPSGKGKEKIAAISRLGSLFLFNVAGEIQGTVSVSEFAPVAANGTIGGFTVTFRNRSTVHVAPQGAIEVYTAWGKKVADMAVNPSAMNALAESDRAFASEWHAPFFSLLPLRAHLHAYFDAPFPSVEKDITFYNLPIQKMIRALLVVIIVLGIAGWLMYRKKIRRTHHLITSHE